MVGLGRVKVRVRRNQIGAREGEGGEGGEERWGLGDGGLGGDLGTWKLKLWKFWPKRS
jgi:hypothetical protein